MRVSREGPVGCGARSQAVRWECGHSDWYWCEGLLLPERQEAGLGMLGWALGRAGLERVRTYLFVRRHWKLAMR